MNKEKNNKCLRSGYLKNGHAESCGPQLLSISRLLSRCRFNITNKGGKEGGPELRHLRTTTCFQKAFTLIELLVVVIIIGILAAIALPQYEKAVEKARFTEAVMAVEEIARAQDLYKMANGQYTRDINDLDISFGGADVTYDRSYPAKRGKYFDFVATNGTGGQTEKALVTYYKKSTQYDVGVYTISIAKNGKRKCSLYKGSTDQQAALCREWAKGN